ncbi:MAG: acyl-CoA/acyl-ACP dehydrogenase [Acidihalobacter sp.]|uniref:acyl-CoA dehydrogenase family protein n=1 Tax=Acidihalobacter sp. TaxID=1872108 RepID=UPI00307EBFC2
MRSEVHRVVSVRLAIDIPISQVVSDVNSRELELLFQGVQEIATDVVAVNTDVVDRDARWPEAGIRALQGAGLGGLVVPEKYGGRGHGLLTLARVCEILGRECASTAICYGMHCVGASVIAANATIDQQARFLGPICEGDCITTLSLSEAGTGAHFYFPQTKLESAASDVFTLNGTKTFVTNGGHADLYVVSAVGSDPESPAVRQFSCVVVPADAEGVKWGAPWDGLGMRGNSSRAMELHCVLVPRSNLLGKEGDQIWYIFNVVMPYFLAALAGTYLGVATTAVEEARRHLMRRHHAHTGANLAQASVLQHRMGSLWGMLERTRCLIYEAAASFDAGEPDALTSVMAAKVEAADAVVTLINEAMTISGGIGYREGSSLHRLLRDARASHLMSPTTDILRLWIGRALLGLPLLSD